MSDFLFRINEIGVIDSTYFFNCDTDRNIPQSVYLFLDEKTGTIVKECLTETKTITSFHANISNLSFNVVIYPIGSQFLFYGTSLEISQRHIDNLINLLSILAFHYSKPQSIDKTDNQFIYNSIQKLNNELLNKTREAEKLNNRLNHLNSILSDRLVQDPLTNLVSRYQYRDEIERLLIQFPNEYALFWFMDIDDFKAVNDNYGHSLGDKYLIEFAKRLKTLPFPNTIKMRIAGDEFGLFIANIKNTDELSIDNLCNQFKSHVIYPIKIDNVEHSLSVSIGISIYRLHTDDIHQLIDFADIAMYQAKKNKDEMCRVYKP